MDTSIANLILAMLANPIIITHVITLLGGGRSQFTFRKMIFGRQIGRFKFSLVEIEQMPFHRIINKRSITMVTVPFKMDSPWLSLQPSFPITIDILIMC